MTTPVQDPEIPTPPPVSGAAAVAAALAEPNLDLRAARRLVEVRAQQSLRLRRYGMISGVAAAVLLVVVGLVVLFRDDSPRQVVADGDATTTSTTAPTTTAAPVTVAPTTVVSTTAPPTTVKPVVSTTTTTVTTLPPNRALDATLRVSAGVEAGRTVTAEVAWSDADIADPLGPQVVAVWGDPLVSSALVPGPPRARCDTPGRPGAGTVPLTFRWSTPGSYTLRVELTTCGGQGPYGETRTLTVPVEVGGAKVTVLGLPTGAEPGADAAVTTYPGGAAPTEAARPVERLGQVLTAEPTRPAFVLGSRAATGDVLELRWGARCAWGRVGADQVVSLGATAETGTCYSPPAPTPTTAGVPGTP
ncbi:MAG: hypothetical protein ACOYOP_04555 [Microthrixaceae bacterium]